MEEGSRLNPLISICIPVHNAASFVKQTLTCLCEQQYSNIELIIVNDGSRDESASAIAQIKDPRITLLNVANGGAATARNIAFNNSKGEYIIFFDADDYVPPDFIKKQVSRIAGRDDIVVFSRWGRFYNEDIQSVKPEKIPDIEMNIFDWVKTYWYKGNPMTNPGRAIIPRRLIDKAGLWNPELSLNDDFEFFTRLLLQAKKIIFNGDALFFYRSGINGLSSSKNSESYFSYYQSINLAVNSVLTNAEKDDSILLSCANIWQLFVYSTFPRHTLLIKKAEKNIKILGGSDLPFPSGKISSILANLIGWKTVQLIKISLLK